MQPYRTTLPAYLGKGQEHVSVPGLIVREDMSPEVILEAAREHGALVQYYDRFGTIIRQTVVLSTNPYCGDY
jgi:hypothetical protein